MKRQITMQNYFSTKKLNNENKSVDSSDIIIQGQDDITNNPGNNYDTTSSTDSYNNSDSESNIGDLIKEPEPNTKISVASVLKKCPGPSDISQNLNNEPTQPNLTFYPKTKYGDRWRHFSKQWFKSFAWLEYSIL
uniref:Uncharacterized protein n=1 Tax=Sipha flava TaxID=143950 RepID=A0A2S2QYD5_9HEMI